MPVDNGGPAFPIHPELASRLGAINSESDSGMSLRDWFAGQAILGTAATYGTSQKCEIKKMVEVAFCVADAMLEARKR